MRKILGILTLVAVAFAAPAWAESSAEAKVWLEKMGEMYGHGPFSMDYDATMQTAQMGQTVDVTMDGKVTYGDEKHMRMDLNMKMGMAGATMDTKMLGVADGEIMWMEVESPMMGGRQIMKVALDRMDDLAKTGGGAAMGGGSMDPMSQVRDLAERYDFQVADVSGGRVTLTATLSDEDLKDIPQAQGTEDADKLALVLDEKTGVPVEVRMGGDTPYVTMHFNNLKSHEPGSLPDDYFTYTPPEGAQVVDLGQMMEMQGNTGP
jgi:outer membrane lipoprotein-sorting protein